MSVRCGPLPSLSSRGKRRYGPYLAFPGAVASDTAPTGFATRRGETQAEAAKIAQRAGIDHAKASADKTYRGRKPSFTRKQHEMARVLLGQERVNVGAIADETGLSRQ